MALRHSYRIGDWVRFQQSYATFLGRIVEVHPGTNHFQERYLLTAIDRLTVLNGGEFWFAYAYSHELTPTTPTSEEEAAWLILTLSQ